jgi:hypothetical protein
MLIHRLGLGSRRTAAAIDTRIAPNLSQQRMAAIRLATVDHAQVAGFADLGPADPLGVNPTQQPKLPQPRRR